MPAKRVQSMLKTVAQRLTLLLCTGLLANCASVMPPQPNDPEFAPVSQAALQAPPPNPGGIYQPTRGLGLFADRRATRVGDVINVLLTEKTVSKKSSGTSVTKDGSMDFNDGALLGVVPSLGAYSLLSNIGQKRDFSGAADSDQSNSLEGSIAVTVAEVLPNGLLRVRGEKWLTLNTGDEFIRLKGLIRPEDIAPDNSISSTRLADARISYSGRGSLANANKMGWVSKFFNSPIWPF